MPIGEEGDFRTIGFMMKNLFPGQDRVGGPGSAMLQQWTQPSGGTNMSSPVPPLADTALTFPNITFPGITFPNQLPPIIISGVPGEGAAATGTVKVYGPAGSTTTAPTDATQILFQGTALVDVAVTSGNAVVTYDSSGGGGGSTLVYGYVSGTPTRITGGIAAWSYSVVTATAGTVTARNLLEKGNTSSVAYGYTIAGGVDRISGTSYYIFPVPSNTWVRMELTTGVDGTNRYWFSAPNFINGGC